MIGDFAAHWSFTSYKSLFQFKAGINTTGYFGINDCSCGHSLFEILSKPNHSFSQKSKLQFKLADLKHIGFSRSLITRAPKAHAAPIGSFTIFDWFLAACKGVLGHGRSKMQLKPSWTEQRQAGGAQLPLWGPPCTSFVLQVNCIVFKLIN